MSEEILKALMQLFAIIANQDMGSGDAHKKYVELFLRSQISEDRISEFMGYYQGFLKTPEEKEAEQSEGTSMTDSVRTLSICKKINKTLNQKQKIIVFTRLYEFILADANESALRNEILETVGKVFKISGEEYKSISQLFGNDFASFSKDFLIVHDETIPDYSGREVKVHGFPGLGIFYYIESSNIILAMYRGDGELMLNGLPLKPGQINVFSPGSSLRHAKGTVFYSDIINRFLGETFENSVTLSADIEEHRHANGKLALHTIKLREQSGSLIGIMGASGSGKTTLLNVLSGGDRLSKGSIRINSLDMVKDADEVKGFIGLIPQDDLLMEELTVYENLFLSAQLCFRDISKEELEKKVDKVLTQLGLFEIRDIKVGSPLNKKISGGQRKRLNIALELIRETPVLYVDEPTSGLSSKDSENVMDLLKELTHKGKLIFVVIHQPSSDIYKLFDKIFLLDTGGYPVFYGNPMEALMYFKRVTNQINSDIAECHTCGSVNPELIFNIIESKEIDEYGNYTLSRKITPERWNELFRENFESPPDPESGDGKAEKASAIPTKLKQWWVYLKRDVLSKYSNTQYILINLLEIPLIATFLSLLIRYRDKSFHLPGYSYYKNDNIPAYFFMTIIVALLVGLTVSAEEIFKDQKILKREKFLRLSRFSYLLSKLTILFTISFIQAFLLVAVGNMILGVPGNFMPLVMMVFSVFCAANLMGLVLSSTFNSPVTIYVIIPLLIIPQMLLGGAMFKFAKLNEYFGGSSYKVPVISQGFVSRWAYEGIVVNKFKANNWEKELFPLDMYESQLNYRLSYLVPKLEELMLEMTADDRTDEQKTFIKKVIENTLQRELVTVSNEFGEIDLREDDDTLEVLKEYLVERYNLVADRKEEVEVAMKEKNILPVLYTNESLKDAATNVLAKEKIIVDTASAQLVQVVDPVFKMPVKGMLESSFGAHFYAPYKYLFGVRITTYAFNLLVIWLLNIFTFLVLYFDLFKILFGVFQRNKF